MRGGKPVRLAVVGLGMAAKPHLEALGQLRGRIDVSGLFNRSADKTRAACEAYDFPAFERFEDLVADPDTDGAILITPPDQRRELVARLAAAGKHVLCEKPLERNAANAQDLVDTCTAHNVRLGVVFQHRFRAGAERLRILASEGALGEISVVRADIPWWRDQAYYDVPGRGTYARDGGGVLISQAIHVADLMLSLTAPVTEVQAFCARSRSHQLEAEDFAAAGLRFADGAVGSIVATTATFPGAAESLVIDGTKATAELRAGQLTVSWRDGRREDLGEVSGTGAGADPMAFPSDWHRDLIADFADAIANGRSPRISGAEGIKVLRLIDALTESARQGTVIRLS